jgi:lipopolysaccharide assembly protein A
MQIFLFVALFIAALAILFAAQNNDPTTVSFFFWQTQSSLALVLLISLAVGAVISFFFSLPSNVKARWTIRQQRKKMTELETSLASTKSRLDETQARLDEAQNATNDADEKLEPASADSKLAVIKD